MTIEAKKTMNTKSMKEAKKQIEKTKEFLIKWFGADLEQSWNFFSAIYCEKEDKHDKLNKACHSDFVFQSPDDLMEKLTKLHQKNLKVCKSKYNCFFNIMIKETLEYNLDFNTYLITLMMIIISTLK